MPRIRKGQVVAFVPRSVFRERFHKSFFDPAYDGERDALQRIEAIAWKAYREGRKAPRTRKAGAGFADPDYELSVEWSIARAAARCGGRDGRAQIEGRGGRAPQGGSVG